jgi:hypothetical protein
MGLNGKAPYQLDSDCAEWTRSKRHYIDQCVRVCRDCA